MPGTASRSILAGLMIAAGMLMLVSAPVSAVDADGGCTDSAVNFSDVDPLALFSTHPTIGPVTINLAAGEYDIVLSSSDITHGSGLHLDQLHESWFFTLDNGYVSPITPDFGDSLMGTAISVPGITLAAATQITAHWAGQPPSTDSVHAAVSFICVRQSVPDSTTTTAATTTSPDVPVTVLASTTVPDSSVPDSTVPGSTVPDTTTTTSAVVTTTSPPPTTGPTVTTEPVGEIGGTSADNPELAATGISLTLAISGMSLVVAGFGLVLAGSYVDRRRPVMVHS